LTVADPHLAVDSHLSVDSVTVRFGSTVAVDNVSLRVPSGTILGLVGESGSGKTTLARVITGEIALTEGRLLFDGAALSSRRSVIERRAIQMVFQDPYASLNPRMTVRQTLGELLRVHKLARGRSAVQARSEELLDLVRLPRTALDAYPGQFSGGQRQRIAIARALAVEPSLIVADEPTSALDVSVQATVLDLFADLRRDLGLTMVFISHDLAVVNRLCDSVVVMRAGQIVEDAPAAQFFAAPTHEYSKQLLAAAPRLARTPLAPPLAPPISQPLSPPL
jgi:ABC-type glutathione transport system ATPase component